MSTHQIKVLHRQVLQLVVIHLLSIYHLQQVRPPYEDFLKKWRRCNSAISTLVQKHAEGCVHGTRAYESYEAQAR